jgi:ATP-binding cassette subfamily B protein
MIRIFAKMKKNMGFIILIFFLLFLQAVCDLSLPEYTSKIVDTGIQQKGIEDAVPEKMRASARDALLILSDNKGKSHGALYN